jgi:hypothetical protein
MWGALKSVKYISLRLARKKNSCGAGGSGGVPGAIFLASIKGWSRLELLLTCRQDVFAEDILEEERRAPTSGIIDTHMQPYGRCIQKTS